MTTFVLVHGSFHGAWCWFKLVPELEALGHRVVTLDLPAQGDDTTPIADVTYDMNVDRVVDIINEQDESVVLVGHSFGGASITGAAERIPERIKLLVYLTAFIPQNGESINMITSSSIWPPEEGARAFVRSADGLSVSVVPEGVRARFYQDCSDEDLDYCLARLRPQPFAPRDTPIHTTQERFGTVPRAYIYCEDDRSILPSVQRLMVERTPCQQTASLPTGHSAFLAAPEALAKALSEFSVS
jgi:pimeloyl-ACP methyl ester carboxylesterase